MIGIFIKKILTMINNFLIFNREIVSKKENTEKDIFS